MVSLIAASTIRSTYDDVASERSFWSSEAGSRRALCYAVIRSICAELVEC
jgi:hypothetical protein